ncbi:MAG: VanZ family protein [Anaerolineae bacterium]
MLRRLLPSLAWMGVIFLASSQPSLPSADDPLLDVMLKKAGHITAYAILMALLLRSATPDQGSLTRGKVIACCMILVGYACSDEFHQSFVPGRNSSLTDVILFDATGGLLGLAYYFRTRLRREKHSPQSGC